ncbi:MAG: hypothetical protein WAR21_07585 [Candidatus Acidiferrales bacterium]
MGFSLILRADDRRSAPRGRVLAALLVLAALAAVAGVGCKRLYPADTAPLDKAGMWFRSIEELRGLAISDAEVAELVKAREAGLSDAGCIELVRLARGHQQPFASGNTVANLRRVDVSEATILELARLDQLGVWAGEAQAIRLTGLSDRTLLAVASRRAAGQPVLSGPLLARLKNAELSEAEILDLIDRGTTDEQAQMILAARQRAAGGSGFVRYHRRRR